VVPAVEELAPGNGAIQLINPDGLVFEQITDGRQTLPGATVELLDVARPPDPGVGQGHRSGWDSEAECLLGCFNLVKAGLLAPVGQLRPTLLKGHNRAQELSRERPIDAANLDTILVLDIQVLALIFVIVAGGFEIGESTELHLRGSGSEVDPGGTREDKTVRMKAVGLVLSDSRLDTWSDSPVLGDNGGAVEGV
jgi:hypothetical protein